MRIEVPLKNRVAVQWTHVLWLFIFITSFSLQSAGLAPVFQFDRALVDEGQWWLMLTGNFVHLNWTHFLLNMAGLLIVGLFFSLYGSLRDWLFVLVFSSAVVGVCLYLFIPELKWYVGLSGVLHGLFIYGAIREIRYYPFSGYILLLLLLAKLVWEYMNGALPGSEEMTGGHVIVESHMFGALGGLAAIVLTRLAHEVRKRAGVDPD